MSISGMCISSRRTTGGRGRLSSSPGRRSFAVSEAGRASSGRRIRWGRYIGRNLHVNRLSSGRTTVGRYTPTSAIPAIQRRGRSSLMFERFTDRARRVVVLAQEEARMLNHNYIGTEHILLGLI